MTSKFAAALTTAIILTSALARADAPSDAASKAINADYQMGCTAAITPTDANLDAAFAYLAPDYVDTDVKGKRHTRDEVVSAGKQQMKQLHTSICDPTIESSTLNADGTVTVVTSLHVTGTLTTPDGDHNLEVTARSQDTWKQINGTWMQTSSTELRNLVKMDGNVVQDEGQ